jgi:hypothetical protein
MSPSGPKKLCKSDADIFSSLDADVLKLAAKLKT